jgi:hypothetical protein
VETIPTNGNGNIELTEDQIKIIGMFNDFSFENPNLTFEEVMLKEFGHEDLPRLAFDARMPL